MSIKDDLRGINLGHALRLGGILLVAVYILLEIILYRDFLGDVLNRPLEHLVIFSIIPLSISLSYVVDKMLEGERELFNLKQERETVLNSLGEGILELDKDFNVLYINRFALSILKIQMADTLGRKCYELIHGLKEVCSDCAVWVSMNTEKPSFTSQEWTSRDGKKTCVDLHSYPVKDSRGRPVKFVISIRDVTDLRRHEKEMLEKQFLEKIHKFSMNREVRMVELKKRIRELEDKIKKLETRQR